MLRAQRDARPLAVLASRIRVEEKRLLAELDRRRISYAVLDTRRTAFQLDRPCVPYRGALVREISHHRALCSARVLAHLGVATVNSAEAISLCGDKLLTTLALRERGVPTPRCMVALTPESALDALEEFGYPAVTKPGLGRALRAEGVPVQRYQQLPLPRQPAFQDRAGFAGYPWRLAGAPAVRYEPARFPVSAAVIEDSLTLQHWHLNPASGPVLDRCAGAFEKVWDHLSTLATIARR